MGDASLAPRRPVGARIPMDDPGPDLLELPDRQPRLKKLRLMLVLSGVATLALISIGFGMLMAVAADLPELDQRAEYQDARNSVLTDVNGDRLAVLADQGRILVELGDVAQVMQQAIISIEDQRFYENAGVDLRGTGRALYQDIVAGGAVQGGSTITQQFVKNATEAQDQRTITQKIREAALAFHLTRKWSKPKILVNYLNSIYFGNGAYGIESAARAYFGNDVNHQGCGTDDRPCAAELKPHEAALLAGIVASPSMFDPVTEPQAARERRDTVLRAMLDQGRLLPPEYRDAIEQPLPASDQVDPPTVRSVTPGSAYFTSWVRQQVVDRYGAARAFRGGLNVRTTLDLELQQGADEAVNAFLGAPDGPSAALVALDNESGEVRAMVGGRDYEQAPFNLAVRGRRQPGSAFKPFVLAAALEDGIAPGSTWSSREKSLELPGGGLFEVENYEGSYAGVTTLAGATTTSDNSVYAEVGLAVGPDKVADLAEEMGIRTEVSENAANALGGLEDGVTVLDMAHAYQTLAADGERVSGTLGTEEMGPVGIRAVGGRDDDRVLDRNRRESRRVLPEETAAQTREILSTVVTSGTATAASLGPVETVWGKTGTTENYGDAWFVGATEEMTVAVWVGYAEGTRPMETDFQGGPVAGGTYPAMIWQDFMTGFLELRKERLTAECEVEREEALEEAQPDGIPEEPQVCIDAGLAPDPNAPPPPVVAPVEPAPGPEEVVPEAPLQEAPPVEVPVEPAPAPVEPAPVEPTPVEPPPAAGGGASDG
ncbi:MAG: transglycosylase domain-containing protein [Actinomycetota bacterium]|nr:transglycosylase domain-containing protein [Actinomycetota bacterium]